MDPEIDEGEEEPQHELPRLHARLANGHWVTFECRKVTVPAVSLANHRHHLEVHAIQVRSDEEKGRFQSTLLHELRMPSEFQTQSIRPVWAWLRRLLRSRAFFDYDSVEEIVADLAMELEYVGMETACHHYDHPPDFSCPDDFDRYDDSASNDQEDPLDDD